jgi:hypothetical protein
MMQLTKQAVQIQLMGALTQRHATIARKQQVTMDRAHMPELVWIAQAIA